MNDKNNQQSHTEDIYIIPEEHIEKKHTKLRNIIIISVAIVLIIACIIFFITVIMAKPYDDNFLSHFLFTEENDGYTIIVQNN